MICYQIKTLMDSSGKSDKSSSKSNSPTCFACNGKHVKHTCNKSRSNNKKRKLEFNDETQKEEKREDDNEKKDDDDKEDDNEKKDEEEEEDEDDEEGEGDDKEGEGDDNEKKDDDEEEDDEEEEEDDEEEGEGDEADKEDDDDKEKKDDEEDEDDEEDKKEEEDEVEEEDEEEEEGDDIGNRGFEVNEIIYARWRGNGLMYLAKIMKIENTTVTVCWMSSIMKKDKDIAKVHMDDIHKRIKLKKDMLVSAMYYGEGTGYGHMFLAKISSITKHSVYVHWDDNATDNRKIPQSLVCPLEGFDNMIAIEDLKVGDRVQAVWKGLNNGYRFPAKVASINDNNTISVFWEDGGYTHRDVTMDELNRLY